ncbi:MAG: protein-export chaperone SecB [Syntrophales bacterium]|jgi:preprotein translocase subunit SecB
MFVEHPITIESVFPTKLEIKANVRPEPLFDYGEILYKLSVGTTEYDKKKKIISVGLKFETEEVKNKKNPFDMAIELLAFFKVDESKFSPKDVPHWANHNAPYILYPYMREQVYALTVRAGFKPLLLPLVGVPTFQAEKKSDA